MFNGPLTFFGKQLHTWLILFFFGRRLVSLETCRFPKLSVQLEFISDYSDYFRWHSLIPIGAMVTNGGGNSSRCHWIAASVALSAFQSQQEKSTGVDIMK